MTSTPWSRRARILLAGGALAVAVAGLALTPPGPLLVSMIALQAACAVLWLWLRSRERIDDRPADSPAASRDDAGDAGPDLPIDPGRPRGGPSPRPSLRALSIRALCTEWQCSYVDLCRATDAATRAEIAGLRQDYLDELERRDPGGVARWLAVDPRPAGTDLHRYVTATTSPPPPG